MGRPAGSENKNKGRFRALFEGGVGDPIPERLVQWMKKHPEDELRILEIALPYCYPKLAPALDEADEETKNSLEERLKQIFKDSLNDPNPPRQ